MGDVRFFSLFGGKLQNVFNLGRLNGLYSSRRQFNFFCPFYKMSLSDK